MNAVYLLRLDRATVSDRNSFTARDALVSSFQKGTSIIIVTFCAVRGLLWGTSVKRGANPALIVAAPRAVTLLYVCLS